MAALPMYGPTVNEEKRRQTELYLHQRGSVVITLIRRHTQYLIVIELTRENNDIDNEPLVIVKPNNRLHCSFDIIIDYSFMIMSLSCLPFYM